MGPTLLRNLTHVPFSPIGEAVPQFVCQKVEAYSVRGNHLLIFNVIKIDCNLNSFCFSFHFKEGKLEVRRCALQLSANQTCDNFYRNYEIFARDVYLNVSCVLCDYDSCNSGAFNSIWIPILFTSIISCVLIK